MLLTYRSIDPYDYGLTRHVFHAWWKASLSGIGEIKRSLALGILAQRAKMIALGLNFH